MIRITCTSCNTVLSIDDAFAGGVCRCQRCGTIQTVPAHLKGSAEREQPVVAGGAVSKALYQNKARGATAVGSGSGLDDLAGIVASSGLSDNRLRKTSAVAVLRKNPALLLGIAGGVIVLLIVLVIVLLMRSGKPDSSTSQAPPADTTPVEVAHPGSPRVVDPEAPPANVVSDEHPPAAPQVAAVTGPNCSGIKLSGKMVVYLIDNGSSSSRILDYVKSAVYQSALSLGPSRQFEILFWNPESPTFGPAAATAANVNDAKTKLDDVVAAGSTEAAEGIKKALAANPSEIVLLTAKGLELEESSADAIIAARGSAPAKIHVIDINGAASDAAASRIAAKTGGTFAPISEGDIKAAGN